MSLNKQFVFHVYHFYVGKYGYPPNLLKRYVNVLRNVDLRFNQGTCPYRSNCYLKFPTAALCIHTDYYQWLQLDQAGLSKVSWNGLF